MRWLSDWRKDRRTGNRRVAFGKPLKNFPDPRGSPFRKNFKGPQRHFSVCRGSS